MIDVQVEGAAGTVDGYATGSVTFTNGSTTLAVVPVSAAGTAEFNASNLAPGSYSIGASYSGDASYKASTVAPIVFSITQAPTQGFIVPDVNATYNLDGSYGYKAGQNANLALLLFPNIYGGGLCPTGNVTFQLGSAAPVTSPIAACENFSFFGYSSVSNDLLSNLQVGTYNLTATYAGDTNYTPLTVTQTIEVVPSTLLPSTISVTISPSLANINPSSVVTITTVISGNGTIAPTGTASFTLGNLLSSASPYKLTPTANATATVVLALRAADLLGGPNVLIMSYSGDSHYLATVSSANLIPNNNSDFSLATITPKVIIKSGATGSGTAILTSENGFAGSVSLTCTAPAALACTLPASSASLTAGGTTTATININTVTVTSVSGSNSIQAPLWKGLAAPVFSAMLLFFIPNRKRFGRVLFALVFCVALGAASGCTHSQHTTAEPVFTYANAAPGTYSVVVTGTAANGIVHNQNITVVVQ